MTRPDAVPEQTVRALATVLRPLGHVDRVELLTGGMFATTYRVTLGDGTRVVVKTAPTDTDRLLRYEHDLLRTEAAVYELAAGRPDLLMPRVLLTDLSRTVLPSDVLVVSHLDGVPLVDAGELQPAVADTVQGELGAFMARLHTVRGERFGYPNLDAGLHAETWTEAFGRMVEALLADAARWGTPLPSDEIRAAIDRHRTVLADVSVPALVHTDLWAGNLFVDPATGALVGVIDTLAGSEHASGVVVCPCGFVADHLEVLYDLDIEAKDRAERLGLAFARTESLNADRGVLAALAARVAAER